MYMGNKSFWSEKKILLTGGNGFLGRHIKNALVCHDCQITAPTRDECDFTDLIGTKKMLSRDNFDIVIHAAIDCGDLNAQTATPARIFYNNLTMNSNLFDSSYKAGVKKFVGFGSYWAYPTALQKPLKENEYLDGELEDVSKVNGMIKRMLYVNGWAYKKEYNFNSIHLILPNIYGKNQKTRNVVSALVDKFKQAKSNNENFVRVWGDGSSVRDFLYIDDAVSAILLAIEKYDDAEPLNIGTGIATSIKELVKNIIIANSFSGEIIWEKDKPNGIAYRVLKTDKMKKVLNYTPATSLEEGINIVSSC